MVALKPSRFASLVRWTPDWRLELLGEHLRVTHGGGNTQVAYLDLTEIAVQAQWPWASLILNAGAHQFRFGGIRRAEADRFTGVLRGRVHLVVAQAIEGERPLLQHLRQHLDAFLAADRYLAHHDLAAWRRALARLPQPDLAKVRALLAHPCLNSSALPADLASCVRKLLDVLTGSAQEVASRNADFVKKALVTHADFFDCIEARPLTGEQRHAAVVMEDRNLLIAAAGSGKSSTVVAKIGYALKTRLCEPHEVLAVMFNRNAREELEGRLAQRLPSTGECVATRTFHKLGKDIIAEVEGRQPSPAPWSEDPQAAARFIEGLVEELSGDPEFMNDWVLFRTVCFRPNRELARFRDQRDYDRYLREVGQERDGRRGILTLNGELVRSMEELAIANWLFLQGIAYEYERPYEYQTADRQYRQYHPDFYYPGLKLYHEHFALDDEGKPPAIFAGDYAAGVEWKRTLHAEKGTQLIETTSALYRSGNLFTYLRNTLEAHGAVVRPRATAAILQQLQHKQTAYAPFIRTFITHLKSNGYRLEDLERRAQGQRDSWRAKVFLRVFARIYQRYQGALGAGAYIDFEDMVRRAAEYVAQGRYRHPYRLILVDEFQDISQAGTALVQAMLTQAPGCKLFAVGDDWQSINRFAGADIEVMAHFPTKFGTTATNYLTRTFRSNQGISDVSAAFVEANPAQYRKSVRAIDATAADVVRIAEYKWDEDVEGLLAVQLQELAQASEGRPASVFVLARYNNLRPGNLKGLQARFAGRLAIEFRTVHRSKGLEADHVIVLGMNSGSYGFPSQIEDDPLLELVMPVKEGFRHAEERRLFYVALTRARHSVTLFTRVDRISGFITELLAPELRGNVRYGQALRAPARMCPSCQEGVLREKKGPYGWFLGCSMFPACSYKESIRKA
jgi:DNA helicase IV